MRFCLVAISIAAVHATTACKTTRSQNKDAGGEPAVSTQTAPQVPKSSSGVSGVQAAWVELAGGTTALARVLTTATSCPSLTIDGAALPMRTRAAPSAAYPVLVCEADLPSGAKTAALGSQVLSLPKAMPQRLLIIGDTGCRIKAQGGVLQLQNCNSSADWPLAQIAAAAAAAKPDLIIHVGDYHYREAPCPVGNQECAGAVTGDVWGSWQQDFFAPALPMLEAAPMLFVRGNHEECARAGQGWFTFLDPRAMPAACTDQTPAYWVTVGDHQVAVIDAADDKNMQPSFDGLQASGHALTWWVLHRPFLTAGADDEVSGAPAQLPARWQGSGAVNLVLTGHQHRLAYNQFPGRSWPPELINGNGGTYLDKETTTGQPFDTVNTPAYNGVEWFDYGFATLDRISGGWQLVARDANGDAAIACQLSEALGMQSALSCQPLAAASTPPPDRPAENLPAASGTAAKPAKGPKK